MSQLLTCDGRIAFEQRFVLHHGFIDGIGRPHVLYDSAHIDRDGWWCWYLTTDDGVDQLLLTSLRIALFQRHHFHVVFRVLEHLCTLQGEQFDGLGLVGLYANVACSHLGGLHQQFQSHEYLIGMFHHQPIVGGDIGFAFYSIDDHTFGFGGRRRCEFDERGESSTAHSCDTRFLHTCHNLFGCQFGMVFHQFQRVRAVDALFPFVALHIDDNGWFAVACGIDGRIDLEHGARHRRIDRGRDEAASLSDERSHLHLVALGNYRFGRRTDMLRQRENGLLWQSSHLGLHLVRQFVLLRMNATYTECSCFHTLSSFLCSGVITASDGSAGLGLGNGKFTAWIAFVGQASTHFLHKRHLLKSM